VAGNTAHPREAIPGEIEVALVGHLVAQMPEVAMTDPEGVFEDELKGGARRFRDVEKKYHVLILISPAALKTG
jgi:hypothetical protein